MSESMNTAIKTISLDDIGDVQARSPKVVGKNANMLYRPTYKTDPSSVELAEQTGTQGGTLTNFRALTDQRSPSSIGIALTNMTRLFGGKMSMQGPMGLLLGIGGVLFSGVLIFLWLQSTEMSSPLERLRDFVAPLFGENLPTAPRVEATSAQIINEVSLEATVSPNPAANPEGLENPYWNIPNPLKLDENLGASGNLSQSQEERWRQGLAHPFTWQRFKTVREMRQAKLKGSQNLLNDALAQPKFWTRMEAVLGLAELGEEVDIDSVETALGHARSTLIQNYFLRFRHRFNGGELYIMRQAVRLADAGTRLVILQNLMQDRSADNELY